jgi:hypothetical protein
MRRVYLSDSQAGLIAKVFRDHTLIEQKLGFPRHNLLPECDSIVKTVERAEEVDIR